ncbi:myosin-IIIb-like isoform X2 [Mya arenaria]|uniref:myosin-IIIb-like isoform X2 n=1 Tax=Mya arenaria TaxID=6604 RepID=UPI0022E0C08F|nr:myosin-IIIb-like isoform X2 [Mya arenaria]
MGPGRGGGKGVPSGGMVTHDLARVGELDETALLEEIHRRFGQDVIYTYIGDILISVNPYQDLPGLYGEEIGQMYGRAKTLSELPPHVYALGSRAFHSLQRGDGNHALLVSGQSGAGKTEITKMLVAQVARLSQWTGEYFLQEKIIEVNPVLEAFGNASTVLNSNSSRFGKLIELIFSEGGELMGAEITEHMLEKSRVTRQGPGEKNFHIFYNLMCGFTPEERQRYFLDQPEKYRIIDPGHGAPVIGSQIAFAQYKEGMDNLRRVMPVVGFTNQDLDVVFALLAAILHLCNIEMAVEPESGEVIVMNEEEIDFASTLLSVQAEDLIAVLLSNVNWVRGERIVYIKSLSQAVDGRDALAKALYSKLFSWIIQQINFMLHEDERREGRRYTINILDMAGFETFPVNSFEQLCINSANERLQHLFNERIFSLELQEYTAEGLKQPKVKYASNDDLLNMLFQRPICIFSLLEEESSLAHSSDQTLLDKLTKHMGKNDHFRRAKHRESAFSVVHYAGVVAYNIDGFLEKNRDTLSSNMTALMENSRNNLVNELFTARVLETGTLDMRHGSSRGSWKSPAFSQPPARQFAPGDSLSRQAGRKIRQKMKEQKTFTDIPVTANPNTASAHFKNSLQLLMSKLKGAETHFIRCLRPNHKKAGGMFDSHMVMDQLRSTGVLEMTRIRRLGYPVRLLFDDFLHRYQFIAFPMSVHLQPGPRACAAILKAARLTDAQLGSSKVFLRYWHTDKLASVLDTHLTRVVRAQALIRMMIARRHFRRTLNMATRDAEDLELFGNFIENQGVEVYETLIKQDQHDLERAAKEQARHTQSNGHHGNEYEIIRMADVFSPGSQADPRPEDFFMYATRQVYERLDDLDPDVWCKMFYMEYNRPVAKFYLCDKVFTVDGSFEEFDGKHVGLGVFNSPERDEITEQARTFIGKGLQLTKEPDGSVSAMRLGKNDVIVQGYRDPANHCLSGEVIVREGRLPYEQSVKIFDMEEYKSHIGLYLRAGNLDTERLQQLAITSLSFLHEGGGPRDTPCWLCLVSVPALEAMTDPEVRRDVQAKFVQLSLADHQEKEAEKQMLKEVADRTHRSWSKLNTRESHQKREPLRKSRIQIKQQGENIQDRMEYSWQEEGGKGRQMNLSDLQEEDDIESLCPAPRRQGAGFGLGSVANSALYQGATPSPRKDWAKIKVTLKQEKTAEAEEIQRAKAVPRN